jgi:hypothetical protein
MGNWKDNVRHGQGRYRWENGHVYVGTFVEGKREGEGTYLFDTGEKYVGDWKNDLRHGKGGFYDKNGNLLFEGLWVKDRYDKQATQAQKNNHTDN